MLKDFSRSYCAIIATVVFMSLASVASADIFGTGANQFEVDFVTISGDTNPAEGLGVVNNDYRMGVYEISNAQWDKFIALNGDITGTPIRAYGESARFSNPDQPANRVSWYEAARFVNWLNVSTGHQPAYKFVNLDPQLDNYSNYGMDIWTYDEADNGTNLYRHKDAFYYLPNEDEWVKAGYWNGVELQTYATKPGERLTEGDGISGTGWNYYKTGFLEPWAVGSGSEELNGTHDMMGNVTEWMENAWTENDYGIYSLRALRGGASGAGDFNLSPDRDGPFDPASQMGFIGFRVAAEVPEPASLAILALGGLAILRKKLN